MFKLYVVIAYACVNYVSCGTFPNTFPHYHTFPPQYVSSHHTSSHYNSNHLCVLPGTCLSGSTTSSSNTIDIRIVTGSGIPTAPPTDHGWHKHKHCPSGLEFCKGSVSVSCGVQYVSPVSTSNGNATAGAHPWQAYITNETGYTGAGVLLDEYHVLTAAHKVAGNVANPSNIGVYLGVWDPANAIATQNRTASSITLNPHYNSGTLFNDIAIIRLSEPVVLGVQSTVNTACLPSHGASYVGQKCVVAGWGQTQFTNNDSPTSPMRQVKVPIVSYSTCRSALAASNALSSNVDTYLDPNGEICAGGRSWKDACTNDGGAPLMCIDSDTGAFTVAGLVLWGKGCGQSGLYGVYNNVAHYRNWIDNTISSLNSG